MDLVLDVGFSKAYAALLKDRIEEVVVFMRGDEDAIDWITSVVRSFEESSGGLTRIALATTGLVNDHGTCYFLGKEIDLNQAIGKVTRAEIFFINDGHAAALAAKGFGYQEPLLSFHIGTGVGIGMLDDKIYKGFHGYAGEANRDLGGNGIEDMYREATLQKLTAKDIIKRASLGDPDCIKAAQDTRELFLDFVICSWQLFDPATIVFSGGAILDFYKENLVDNLKSKLSHFPYGDFFTENVAIEYSPLKTWAPLFGAALLLDDNLNPKFFHQNVNLFKISGSCKSTLQ